MTSKVKWGIFMLLRGCMTFGCLRSSDLITNLNYVIIDNFCPCFVQCQQMDIAISSTLSYSI